MFIPYKDVDSAINTPEGVQSLLFLLEQWCRNNQDICNPDPQVIYENVTVIQEAYSPYNFTERDVFTLFSAVAVLKDSDTRTKNEVNAILEFIKIQYPEIASQLNISNTRSLKLEDESKDKSIRNAIIIFFLFIIICTAIAGFFIRKYWKEKEFVMRNRGE